MSLPARDPLDPPPAPLKHPSHPKHPSRRSFLQLSGRAMGGGWLALQLPLLASLSACAREAMLNGEPLGLLSPEEGAALEAMTARLIPSVDGMGAREAGAVHFIDRALNGPFRDGADFFRSGLAELVNADFAGLSEAAQIAYLEEIQDGPFFGFARALTIFGTFSDPRHGGGRDDAMHRIYGLEHAPGHQPPFGWYDAQVAE